MASTVKAVKEWMQEEFYGAQAMLQFFLKEIWWAAVLAVGMYYFGEGTGGVKEIVKTMFMVRFLKMPFEILQFVKTDLSEYL